MSNLSIMYCSKCQVHYFIESDDNSLSDVSCRICGQHLENSGITYEEYKELPKSKRCEKCKRNYPKMFIKCPKCYSQLRKKSKSVQPINITGLTSSDSESKNVPTCPTCHSTNIEKIGTGTKVVGFATVGIFSKNFGKTFHCKDCDYRW